MEGKGSGEPLPVDSVTLGKWLHLSGPVFHLQSRDNKGPHLLALVIYNRKFVLGIHPGPGPILDIDDTTENKTNKKPCREFIFWVWGRRPKSRHINTAMSGMGIESEGGFSLMRVHGGLLWAVTSEQNLNEGKEQVVQILGRSWGKGIRGWRSSQCKGPEAGSGLEWLQLSEAAEEMLKER